jgi:hypothetical protein
MWVVLITAASLACARDDSITHGADGAPEWDRRLAAAIAPGMIADSAHAILQREGFRCQTSTKDLYCTKESGGRFTIVRRHWKAILAIQDGHVRAVKGVTGLTGP